MKSIQWIKQLLLFIIIAFTVTPTLVNADATIISVNSASIYEPDSNTSNMYFKVELGATQNVDITFDYHTTDGIGASGATSPEDFTAVSAGTYTIPHDTGFVYVPIAIKGDLVSETTPKTFKFTLDSVSAAYITINTSKKEATGTIYDLDNRSLTISSSSVAEGGTGKLDVNISGNTASVDIPISITLGGTATSGSDYGTVTIPTYIPAGSSGVSISIPTTDDTEVENNETVIATLSTTSGVPVSTSTGTLTITDNDKYQFEFETLTGSVTEGTANITFMVKINQTPLSGQTASVKWRTYDGNATSGDYTQVTSKQTLTFNHGDTNKSITVAITDDVITEFNEYFTIKLSDQSTNATIRGSGYDTATATIVDNDSRSISIADATVNESAGTVTMTVTMTGPTTSSSLPFTWAAAEYPSSAVSPGDFTASSGNNVAIPADGNTTTFTVPITNNTTPEANEYFKVTLTSTGVAINDGEANVTITDDDKYTVSITGPSAVMEGATTQDFNISVSPSILSGDTITLDYTTVGKPTDSTTATSGSDFTAISGTALTFDSTHTSRIVTVTIKADSDKEGDETYNLKLSNLSTNAKFTSAGTTLSASATIIDDDNRSLRIGDANVTEGGTLNLTVTMDGNTSSLATPFSFTLADGTGVVAGSDYTTPAQFIGSIPAGSSSTTISIVTIDDTVIEGNETITVTLSSGISITDNTGIATIKDNDRYVVSISPATRSTTEGNSTNTTVSYSVTLNQAPPSGSVTVNYTFAGSGANQASVATSTGAGVDANVSALSGTLTFNSGDSSKTLYATIRGDTTAENHETFTVTLSSPSSNADLNTSAYISTQTIANDDTNLSIDDTTIREGYCGNVNATITARITNAVNFNVLVPFITQNNTPTASAKAGLDYTATSGTITINAGSLTGTATVPILYDSLEELDETFEVNISNAQGIYVSDAVGVVTIQDNQDINVTTFADVSQNELDSGQNNMRFIVDLCREQNASVTIGYKTYDGTTADYMAVDAGTGSNGGNDYDGTTTGSVTVAAGQRYGYIYVPINGDLKDENDETFTVVLQTTAGVTLTDTTATGTIRDDDDRYLRINDANVTEGDTVGNFTLAPLQVCLRNHANTANATAEVDITFDVKSNDGNATLADNDYVSYNQNLKIEHGKSCVDFNVSIKQDLKVEGNEVFDVNISNYTPGITHDDNRGIVTITDDDNRTVTLSLPSTIYEGDSGYKDVNLTITLNSLSPIARTGTYSTVAISGGADSSDYLSVTNQPWTIDANKSTTTVPVRIYGNMVYENDEDFNVTITSDNGFKLASSPLTVRIYNDDYRLSVSDVNLTEGDSGYKNFTFSISLSGKMKTAVDVNYSTLITLGTAQGGDIDFNDTEGQVNFGIDDNASKNVTVKVKGETIPEGNENFFLIISNDQNVTISKGTGTGTIRNDDNRTLSINTPSFNETEGNITRAFTISLDAVRPFDDLNVTYHTSGDTATAGSDYNETSGTITIKANTISKDVNITVIGDYVQEPNEKFKLYIDSVSPSAGITFPSDPGYMTLTNDDGNLTIVSTSSVNESNTTQTASMTFAVTLTRPVTPGSIIYVPFVTSDFNATVADHDYNATSGTLNFGASETSKTITVTVVGDNKIEGTEVFDLNISNAQGVKIINNTSRGSILEDDGRGISVQDVNVTEGDVGTFTTNVPITINLLSETPISIDYNVTSTDANASDFVASSGTITLEVNQSSISIPITHYGDLTNEGNKRIVIQIATSTAGVSVSRGTGYLTLLNDDGVVRMGDATVTENNSTYPVDGNITVYLSRASTQDIVLHYTMIPDTATEGADYTKLEGNVTISATETNASIPLRILYDVTPEVNEYFIVHITNDQNVTIQDADGNVTIVDDDLDQMTVIDRQREFALIKGVNIYGNYAATGAPIMCVLNDANTTCNWGYTGLLATANTKFLHDNDAVLGTTNSSSADLDLTFDSASGDTVVWAGLYWQGHIEGNNPNALDSNKTGYNQVVFGTPNGKRTITADEYDINQTNYYGYYTGSTVTAPGFRFFYQGFANVTSDVNTSLINNTGRRFSVGGIKATEGVDKTINNPNLDNGGGPGSGYGTVGHFGGWSLVVIYKKADATALPEDLHNVSIYNGYKYIASKNTEPVKELNISVSGFRTPSSLAANTTIDSKLLYFGGGSERKMSGDTMKISNKAGDFNATSDANNDANNTLNDTISILGSDLNATRDYNPGIDLDVIQVGELLDKNQSSTTIKLSTVYSGGGSDQTFAGLVGLSTQLHQPQLCYDFSYKQNGQFLKNDISLNQLPTISGYVLEDKEITAGIYLKNTDSDFSIRGISLFTDMNGSKVSYVSPSTQITRVNGVSYQGIESEDPGTCDYIGSSTDIACSDGTDVRIGVGNNATGYTKSAAGSLNSSDFVFAQFKVDPHNLSGDVNESLGLKVDHCIDFENLETGVPQELCITGILGKTIPLCTKDTTSTYNPAWGTFNIVDTNANPTTTTKNNLYTQIAKKPFDVSLAVYDKGVDGSYNHLPTVDVNTTVMVEVIDAGAYQDVNTSCTNPDANTTIPVFVEINATAAHNTQSILAQIVENPNDYNVAVRNAAFRIWWFDDGSGDQTTLAQNWKVSTADSTRKDSASSYSTDLYNPVTHNTKCGGDCGTPTSSTCFTCLKKYYMHPICSRDNFAIRPEGFKVDLKDKSTTIATPIKVAAGYDYNLSVTATNHVDETNVIGYTPGYGIASGSYIYTSSMDWNSVKTTPDCTTDANVSLETVLKTMHNGYLDYNLSHGNVGEYLTNLTDDSWTAADQVTSNDYRTAAKGFDTTKDCLVGNANTTGATNTIGCRITTSEESTGYTFDSAKRAFRFYPHHYDMTSMKFTKGLKFNEVNATTTNNFIYMADMNDSNSTSMSLRLNGNIVALGDDNSTLSNFKAGCYAQDINLSMNMTASLTNLQGCVIRNGESNCSSTIASIASFNNMFASATHGTVSEGNFTGVGSSAPVTIYLNYDRNNTTAINPLNVTVGSVSTIDAAGTKIAANENASQDITGSYNPDDFNVRFYYGRAHGVDSRVRTADQNTTTAQGNVRVNFEIYCSSDGRSWCNDPALLALLPNVANTPHGEDRGWFKNIWQFGYEENNASDRNYGLADLDGVIGRKSGDGNVTVNTTRQTVSGNTINPSEIGFKSYGVTYDGKKGYPHTVIMRNQPDPWLVFDPKNVNGGFNEFTIEFYKPNAWVGSSKTDTSTDSDASVNPSRRIMW